MDAARLLDFLRQCHIVAGFLGLVAFWLPLLARKGGRLHVVCGWVFVGCAGVVIATTLIVCGWRLIDPLGLYKPEDQPATEQAVEFARRVRSFGALLGAVAVYTLVPLVLAVRVVQTRQHPERLGGAVARILFGAEIVVSLSLIVFASIHLISDGVSIVDVVSLAAGIGGFGVVWWDWRFVANPRTRPMFWWYKHMEFMLRTGIAFHTAFLIFGAKPWLGSLGIGPWAVIPWVLPSAVGLPIVWWWVRHYRRKFGELSSSTSSIAKEIGSDSSRPGVER